MGLNRQDGQVAARLAILMVLSRHESQKGLEVDPPLGPAAMACNPILIQVTVWRARSGDQGTHLNPWPLTAKKEWTAMAGTND